MYAKISTFTFIPISTEQLQWISGGKKEHVFLKRKKGSKERKKERKKATRTTFVFQFLLT